MNNNDNAGIRVAMMGMWGIEVGIVEIGGGNEEGQGENLCIRMERMNKKCGEG